MTSMQAYLSSVKTKKNEAQLVIIGNEAADLDSMASSIAYGFLCSILSPAQLALPVMPIPRADFILRTEAVYVFKEAGINLDDVVFFDEVDLDSLMTNANLALVDHNILATGLAKFSDQVVTILDHHKDEGLYTNAVPRIIEPVGSTTTLVAMEFQKNSIKIDKDVATLISGTILLDTVNLDDEAGRVTDADKKIAAQILPLCPLPQEEFFNKVQEAKFNVQGLSTNDLLRKDYKEWQMGTAQCGIGSALLPVKDWSEMDANLAAGFAEFAQSRKLDLLLSMNAYTSPDFHRDLVVFCASEEGHNKLVHFLKDNDLNLTLLSFLGQQQAANGFIGFYSQGNLGISRKKLQPLLVDFFK